MIATIITCFVFKKSANLTNAYGVAVSSVMILTTILLSMTLCVVWRLPTIVAVAFLLVFGTVDLAFLFPTLLKFHDGGWFTILCGVVLASMMLIWRWGSTLKFQHELDLKTSFNNIFVTDNETLDTNPDENELDELTIKNSTSSLTSNSTSN